MIHREDDGTAQSEVVGVLIFTGVVVILVGVVGMFVLSSVDTTSEPTVDLAVTVESNALEVEHDGGDSLRVADVEVVLGADADDRIGLEAFTERQGNGNGEFEAGEVREHAHGATETLSVDVVHEPTGGLLYRKVFDVP